MILSHLCCFTIINVCRLRLFIFQVVIVDGQNAENAATDDGQLEKLNKDGSEETAKMNEYVILLFRSGMFMCDINKIRFCL